MSGTFSPGQASQRSGFSLDTLRYYEKIGLISIGRRANGHREFDDDDLEWLGVLRCLRDTGMPIADMRRYAGLAREGDDTMKERLRLLTEHDDHVADTIETLQAQREHLKEKIAWYTEQLGGPMASHKLEPSPETTVSYYSPEETPRLEIESGDTVTVGSLDASGYLERHQFPGDTDRPTMFSRESRGHCLTGPIAVRGTQTGDMLAVRLTSIVPGDWGWTAGPAAPDSPIARRLRLTGADRAWLLWEIDTAAGTATANGKYTRPIAPFLGVTGTAPAAPGRHSTIPPRAAAGGNIDCKELVAGSVLYLPVNVPGALLYLGDGHAAQGDGESCGTAIECAMTTEVTVSIAGERPLTSVHAQTPAGLITFGFSSDLNEAMGEALDAMVTWLAGLHDTSRAEALALASTCVDLRVTQVANMTWGVHALLPSGLLAA